MIDLTKREEGIGNLPDECVVGAEYVLIHDSAIVGEKGSTKAGMFISIWNNTARPAKVFLVGEVHSYDDGAEAYVTSFVGYEYLVPAANGGFRLEISTSWPSPS